jgi:hypothetical protein
MRRRRIRRPCLDCGRTADGTRCDGCAAIYEAKRQARQPYRAVYGSPEYHSARRIRIKRAGGRCERILPGGTRCPRHAVETHHTIPLSSAGSYEEALALCRWELLEATCYSHNPRGGVES